MTEPLLTPAETARLKAFFDNSLARSLRLVTQWSIELYYQALSSRGHGGMRRRHEPVVVRMNVEGSRAVDIAAANAVTKNAIGQLANELEELGYVARSDDPDDGRAKLLRYTPRGIALLKALLEAGEELEQAVESLIGREKRIQLVALLEELTVAIQRQGTR